ncbi:2-amino-4-hydroxy-6-hydroxymethyldihydropteridine diphosphokinase [Aliikangiella coralliicola]|uniref:2-amino-4-hydroxy-6-hydroxymethyldihydropteridine pyrophosphokinase n=1 Tax=Aliikangiella coralliicola TaxID=2592383 RepID=A0A545UEE3_9GAMM|nr:2-amino-4-hydroxy-6-hydroxymethyldihydropteridine diphosphokinase [Aliikangiella coralliicola]TQV87846.1 2-amino-4-hydroxy-6-hydroxymethyldihydropteridine diphosphokinase [Aliikangiella coralliicola]
MNESSTYNPQSTGKIAFIGLGANLQQPQQQLERALKALSIIERTHLNTCSSFYQSKPMGPQDQNDFTNAVAMLTTHLSPLKLLDQLQKIENDQGRVRNSERWGPRTLDLDLLLYNNDIINEPRLTVPHIGLKQRSFVILPLFEISPDLVLPDGTAVKSLAESIDKQGIFKL